LEGGKRQVTTNHLIGCPRKMRLFLGLALCLLLPVNLDAFAPLGSRSSSSNHNGHHQRPRRQIISPLYSQTSSDDVFSSMRVAEIKSELQTLKIDFSDCFDKESLVARLKEARDGTVLPMQDKTPVPPKQEEEQAVSEPTTSNTSATTPDAAADFDKEQVLLEIRDMSVRDLRQELGRRQISRAGLFEKEDLVQALMKARQDACHFSATGLILPGQVADLSGDQVSQELEHTSTPLVLDVYATWCGPCQMMAPQLQQAALDWGAKIRVAKMDSDKHTNMASQLRVQGLPTIILFQNGKEVARMEGALMKDQLLQWVESKL
jgi:thioredoxin 2